MTYSTTENEKQRAYVRACQDHNTPCPSCGSAVNINAVIDVGNACPQCAARLRPCLGLFGDQWLANE